MQNWELVEHSVWVSTASSLTGSPPSPHGRKRPSHSLSSGSDLSLHFVFMLFTHFLAVGTWWSRALQRLLARSAGHYLNKPAFELGPFSRLFLLNQNHCCAEKLFSSQLLVPLRRTCVAFSLWSGGLPCAPASVSSSMIVGQTSSVVFPGARVVFHFFPSST